MTFDLIRWLKGQIGNYELEIPLVDISGKNPHDRREWLVTNGLGSFASATIWGANSRRYHGLFTAALTPPVRRTLLFSRIDEIVDGQGLATNFWKPATVNPEGYKLLEAFTIYPVPTWVYALPKGHLIKQVMLVPGKQELVVGYSWQGSERVHLALHLLMDYRDFHSQTRGAQDWQFRQEAGPRSVKVQAFDGATPLVVAFDQGTYVQDPCWYWNYDLPMERERGLQDTEDHFHPGHLDVALEPGATITIRACAGGEVEAGSARQTIKQIAQRQCELLKKAGDPKSQDMKRLVLAADNFVVLRDSTQADSIIAGYHWFGDWGRDSMISLPGITLATGRGDVAKGILKTFGQYLSEGMLPNNFPDAGSKPEYNTADATFWWAWALLKYQQVTGDDEFVRAQLPLLDSVVEWHRKGTRYGLRMDENDGLITGGQAGVQLTWMDAKVGDYVVTPRCGKPVEINALWYNFLKILEQLQSVTGGDGSEYGKLAKKTRAGFNKFWNQEKGCLADVIREDGSQDLSIRPNQIIALSLPFDLVSAEQARSILAVVERQLLTPYGLRTLSAEDPAYQGQYGGGKEIANQYDRDVTYHQGTVWPWLLGPWVDARVKTLGATADNMQFIAAHLSAIKSHLMGDAGLGSVSEIFDGNAPHAARGCIAQAWSVAELLRVLTAYKELQ